MSKGWIMYFRSIWRASWHSYWSNSVIKISVREIEKFDLTKRFSFFALKINLTFVLLIYVRVIRHLFISQLIFWK